MKVMAFRVMSSFIPCNHCETLGCLSAPEERYTGHHFYQYLLVICELALSLSESKYTHESSWITHHPPEQILFSDLGTQTHMDIDWKSVV